jgi:molecular chaperone DnaK
MVFDFGGGTLDVTVLRREVNADRSVEIRALASYGVQLGGLQLDERIRDGLVNAYRREAGDPRFEIDRLDAASHAELLALAESFKIDLNRGAAHDPAPLARTRSKNFQPRFDDGRSGPTARLKLTLGEVTAWIAPEIDRAVVCAEEALRRCGASWDALDEVLLTGGSSQLLLVQQRMRERCGERVQVVFDEQDHPLRPSTIVAAGAAIYGASHGKGALPVPIEVRGAVPDAFCVRAFVPDASVPEGRTAVLQPLVPAGTPTPFVGHAQFVMRGGGRVLPIEVFEGAAIEEATPVGTFRLELAEHVADGARVDVALHVGSNGALSLAVRDASTGVQRDAELTDAPGLYSETELDERRAWLDARAIEVRG